jgi:L-serine deaminase
LNDIHQIRVDLYGSLALTGLGHGTPNAILMGLEGETPEMINTTTILTRVKTIEDASKLNLNGTNIITFIPDKHLQYHYTESLPSHPNGMRLSCFNKNGDVIASNEFFSIGGGFVVNNETKLVENAFFLDHRIDHVKAIKQTKASHHEAEELLKHTDLNKIDHEHRFIPVALPFDNAASLTDICLKKNISIAQVVFENELKWRSADEITSRTLDLWKVMDHSIQAGILSDEEYLPGNLKVKRRAPGLHKRLMGNVAEFAGFSANPGGQVQKIKHSPVGKQLAKMPTLIRPNRSLPALDWISMYAIAVNEENAAGGRVVTGII